MRDIFFITRDFMQTILLASGKRFPKASEVVFLFLREHKLFHVEHTLYMFKNILCVFLRVQCLILEHIMLPLYRNQKH